MGAPGAHEHQRRHLAIYPMFLNRVPPNTSAHEFWAWRPWNKSIWEVFINGGSILVPLAAGGACRSADRPPAWWWSQYVRFGLTPCRVGSIYVYFSFQAETYPQTFRTQTVYFGSTLNVLAKVHTGCIGTVLGKYFGQNCGPIWRSATVLSQACVAGLCGARA